MCRVTIDGKNSVFSTGYYCIPKDWNANTGGVRDIRTNNLLEELRTKIESSYDNLLKETGMVTAEILKNEITCIATIPVTLLKAGEEERERLRIPLRSDKLHILLPSVKSSQAYLHEYLLSLNMRDIAFEDITEDFGWGYKLYLKSQRLRGRSYQPLPYMAEQAYLHCCRQGDYPFQSACGCPLRKET